MNYSKRYRLYGFLVAAISGVVVIAALRLDQLDIQLRSFAFFAGWIINSYAPYLWYKAQRRQDQEAIVRAIKEARTPLI